MSVDLARAALDALVLGYLTEAGHTAAARELQREATTAAAASGGSSLAASVAAHALHGRWFDAERAIASAGATLGEARANAALFQLRRQRFLELYAASAEGGEGGAAGVHPEPGATTAAVGELVASLRDLEVVAPSRDAFHSCAYVLTLRRVCDHPSLGEWTPREGRERCAAALTAALGADTGAPPPRGQLAALLARAAGAQLAARAAGDACLLAALPGRVAFDPCAPVGSADALRMGAGVDDGSGAASLPALLERWVTGVRARVVDGAAAVLLLPQPAPTAGAAVVVKTVPMTPPPRSPAPAVAARLRPPSPPAAAQLRLPPVSSYPPPTDGAPPLTPSRRGHARYRNASNVVLGDDTAAFHDAMWRSGLARVVAPPPVLALPQAPTAAPSDPPRPHSAPSAVEAVHHPHPDGAAAAAAGVALTFSPPRPRGARLRKAEAERLREAEAEQAREAEVERRAQGGGASPPQSAPLSGGRHAPPHAARTAAAQWGHAQQQARAGGAMFWSVPLGDDDEGGGVVAQRSAGEDDGGGAAGAAPAAGAALTAAAVSVSVSVGSVVGAAVPAAGAVEARAPSLPVSAGDDGALADERHGSSLPGEPDDAVGSAASAPPPPVPLRFVRVAVHHDAQPIRALAWDPHGPQPAEGGGQACTLAVGSNSKAVRLLRVPLTAPSGREQHPHAPPATPPVTKAWVGHHGGSVYALSWLPLGYGDGLLASCSNDTTVRVVRTRPAADAADDDGEGGDGDGEGGGGGGTAQGVTLRPNLATLRDVAWLGSGGSSGAPLLACAGGGDHTVQLWDAGASNAPVSVFRGHTDVVHAVRPWGAGGRCVASASADGTVRVFDARAGAAAALCWRVPRVAVGGGMGAAAPGGADGGGGGAPELHSLATWGGDDSHVLLAVGAADGGVSVVDATSGRVLASALLHTHEVRSLAVAGAGAYSGVPTSLLLSASFDGAVVVSALPAAGEGAAGVRPAWLRAARGVAAAAAAASEDGVLRVVASAAHGDRALCGRWGPSGGGAPVLASSAVDRTAVVWRLDAA